jgi:hypothetical protein
MKRGSVHRRLFQQGRQGPNNSDRTGSLHRGGLRGKSLKVSVHGARKKREIFKIARGVDSLGLQSPAAQRPMFGSMLLHSSFRVVGKGVEGAHGVSSGTNSRVQTPVMQVPVWH